MKGALIQLLAKGKQDDLFITSNPQLSSFKNVYTKFNDYAKFEADHPFDGQINFGKTVTATIDKIGDLLNDVYLEFRLPPTGELNVSWINSIGLYIIKNIRLIIGGVVIDELTPEFIDAHYRHNVLYGRYISFISMINNISNHRSNSNTGENILYLPLPFWFTKTLGDSLPIIKLGMMDIKIEITFKTLNECLFDGTSDNLNLDLSILECRLYTEMIYLSDKDRVGFLNKKRLDYIIEQRQYVIYDINNNQKQLNVKLNFNNQVKQLFWTYRDDYFKSIKKWNTFALRSGNDELEPLYKINITLNGQDRTKSRYAKYYRLMQPFKNHTSSDGDYFYFFSFCERPSETQPNGYLNLSKIDNPYINFEFADNINPGTLYLYAVSYNILRIENGMAGIMFS